MEWPSRSTGPPPTASRNAARSADELLDGVALEASGPGRGAVPALVEGHDTPVRRQCVHLQREVQRGAGEAVTEHERRSRPVGAAPPFGPRQVDAVDVEGLGRSRRRCHSSCLAVRLSRCSLRLFAAAGWVGCRYPVPLSRVTRERLSRRRRYRRALGLHRSQRGSRRDRRVGAGPERADTLGRRAGCRVRREAVFGTVNEPAYSFRNPPCVETPCRGRGRSAGRIDRDHPSAPRRPGLPRRLGVRGLCVSARAACRDRRTRR